MDFEDGEMVERSNSCWSARISAECMFLIQGRGGEQRREALSVDALGSGIGKARIVAKSKSLAPSAEDCGHGKSVCFVAFCFWDAQMVVWIG
jgi:hypothetical protein